MVTTFSPDDLASDSGKTQKPIYHIGSNTRFRGHKKREDFGNTVNSYTNGINPLKATRTTSMVAFKGLNLSKAFNKTKNSGFFRDLVDSWRETNSKQAGELIEEVQKVLPNGRNPGFDSIVHFYNTGGKGTLKKEREGGLLHTVVHLSEKPTEGFMDALMAPIRWIKNKIKSYSDIGFKNKLEDEIILSKKKKQLQGYHIAVKNHGKYFDEAFSGKNLDKIKELLGRGEKGKDELRSFLKSKKLDTRQLFKDSDDWFKKLNDNLLNKRAARENWFIASEKRRYVSNVITDIEDSKAGSPIARFGSDLARFINKSVSGTTTAVFIAQDFYNLHTMAHDDPEGAKEERNKRFVQQMSYVGLTAYFDYLTGATFKTMSNKYLGFAVGLGVFTSLAANSVSRLVNGVPLLPTKPKGMEKKPYIIKSTPMRTGFESLAQPQNSAFASFNTFNQLRNKSTATSGAPAFKGWNIKQAMKPIHNAFEKVDDALVKLAPEKMKFEKFAEGHEVLQVIQPERADKLLKLAAKHMRVVDKAFPTKGQPITIEHIRESSKKLDGDVLIGKNALCRMGENFVKALIYPFKLVKDIGIGITNGIRKLMRKTPIETNEESRFIHAKAAMNFVNRAIAAKEKVKVQGKLKDADKAKIEEARLVFGEKFSGSHNPNDMSYGVDELSTYMKLTGFISVPFLAIDAYNVTGKETLNENMAAEKAKQRAVQDSTRQAISFWAVKSFNDVFKDISNHSPLYNALSVFANNTGYESLTRLAVGQPILPKTRQQMKEIEKRRLKNPGWLSNVLVKQRVRTEDDKVILGSKKLLRNDDSLYSYKASSYSANYTGFRKNIAVVDGFFKS